MRAFDFAQQSTNFGLKNEVVELIPTGLIAERVSMTLSELESIRTASVSVPASKHGLEVITGASCETGAQ